MRRKTFPRFPIFIDLTDKKVLVVGGGVVGLRRLCVLKSFGGAVTVVEPKPCSHLLEQAEQGQLQLFSREFQPDDVSGMFLVVAATNQREVNRHIGELAKDAGAFVSVADRKEESSFYFPGIVKTQELVAGIISTDGNHRRVKEAVKTLKEEWGRTNEDD